MGARKKFKKKIQCRKARKGFDGCTDWFVGRCSICLILTCIQCGMMFCCGCICCSCSCSCKKEAKRKVNKPKNLKYCIKVLDNESEKRKTILFELVIRDGTIEGGGYVKHVKCTIKNENTTDEMKDEDDF